VPALLDDVRTEPAGRTLGLSLLRSLAPTPALRRASDHLAGHKWLDVFALALAGDIDDTSAAIDLALESGELPNVAALRRLAEATGVTLGDKENPAAGERALALRLAPFGGRDAFAAALDRAREEHGTAPGPRGDTPHPGGQTTLAHAMLAQVPALGHLGLRTLDGRVVDLATLAALPEVRFTARDMEPVGAESDGVVVLSDDVRPTLATLFGEARFVDVGEQLKKVTARRAFEAREVEAAKLDIGNHVLVIDIARDGGMTGQVGLIAIKNEARTFGHVRILRGGRTVLRQEISAGAPCSFVAVIDDPKLAMLADFSAPASPGALASLYSRVYASAEAGVETCVSLYNQSPANNDGCRRVILERLARAKTNALPQKKLRALQAVRIFDIVQRGDEPERVSVSAACAAAGDDVLFVESHDPARRTDKLVLVLRTPVERELAAAAIEGRLVDAGPAFALEERARANRERLPPLPAVPDDALVSLAQTAGRAHIRAWIPRAPPAGAWVSRPPSADGAWVHAGADGRLVRSSVLDVPLPAFAAVLEGADLVFAEWKTAATESALMELEDAALALGHALVDAVVAREKSAQQHSEHEDAARALAVSLALRQHRLAPKWVPLVDAALAVRVFAVGDGARISLAQALADRPPSLERSLRAAGLVAEPLTTPADGAKRLVEVARLAAANDERAADVRAARERPPPPEIVLALRIKETMSTVKLERDAETELARWPVTCERRGGKHAVAIGKNATVVDLEHPLAQAALVDDGDHAAYFMLCAVVYAAVNAHLGAVTDEHERAFLTRLLEHARTAR